MKIVQTLAKEIAENIEQEIINEKLLPTQKIPNEQLLMEKFNVSRVTIREAIKILVTKGILEIRRGKGTFVCDLPGISEDPLGFNFLNIPNLNDYLYETREIFEPYICKLVTERASDEEINFLGDIVTQMEELDKIFLDSIPNKELILKFYKLDAMFHIHLCKICKNPILERLLPIIIQSIKKSYVPEVFISKLKKGSRQSTHTKIYQALKDRNGDLAFDLILKHLQNKK